jgi:hypothetical protein
MAYPESGHKFLETKQRGHSTLVRHGKWLAEQAWNKTGFTILTLFYIFFR